MSMMILGPSKDKDENITNNKKYPFSKILLV